MRKQTKIAAVVSAAALLALGASMTSFAAAKGTWMMEDGEWKCYDKNGDEYTNIFCSSNGKEYYVGEDGFIVRSQWVEYDGERYFVNSSGAKITNDWRLTSPYDDESADEEWYYFQSTGKMATNKKISYKGKTYYFDTDGKMLTGWITDDGTGTNAVNEANDFVSGQTYYCDETGARLSNMWVKDTEPGVEEDDADADEYWYWLKSNGKVATGKQANIKGQVYFFDEEGRMLKDWVAASSSTDGDGKVTWNYEQIDKEDEERAFAAGEDIYYCEYDEDTGADGHAKRNRWVKTWLPLSKAAAESDDLKWFWFDKNGKLYRTDTWSTDSNGNNIGTWSNAVELDFKDGVVAEKANGFRGSISRKKVNSKDYWFRTDGVMVSKFYLIEADQHNELYYFGGSDDGAMKTGSQSIKDDAGDVYKFYFYTKDTSYATDGIKYKKGSGVTGNQNNKLYYYGMLLQAKDYKYQMVTLTDVDGNPHEFIVNSNGSIQHGNAAYKEDGDTLLDTSTTYNLDSNGKPIKDVANNTRYIVYKKAGQFKYSFDKGYTSDSYSFNESNPVRVSSGLPDIQLNEFVDVDGITFN